MELHALTLTARSYALLYEGILYFFDQTLRLLFISLLILFGYYSAALISLKLEPRDIQDSWIRKANSSSLSDNDKDIVSGSIVVMKALSYFFARLVPRPHPASHHLQYGKAGRAWHLFSHEHDVIGKRWIVVHCERSLKLKSHEYFAKFACACVLCSQGVRSMFGLCKNNANILKGMGTF